MIRNMNHYGQVADSIDHHLPGKLSILHIIPDIVLVIINLLLGIYIGAVHKDGFRALHPIRSIGP